MYIYTKIETQTNTLIPITPSLHRKYSGPSTYTSTFTHKKNEVRIPYPLLTTANEADSAYVCDSKRVYSMQLDIVRLILRYPHDPSRIYNNIILGM